MISGSSVDLLVFPNGKRILVAGQKSGVVTAIDPDQGAELLSGRRESAMAATLGGVEWGVAADQSNVYVAVSYVPMSPVPLGTPGAQPFISDPKIALLYDNKAGGGLSALRLDTGDEVWRTPHPGCNDVPGCSPAQSAAVTAIPGACVPGPTPRAFARLFRRQRQDRLGRGHEGRLSDCQWRRG